MIDNSVIEIDNKKYLVVDVIIDEDNKYVYFVNENDMSDLLIQKEIKEDDKTYLVNLENEDEFNKVMHLFEEKNK